MERLLKKIILATVLLVSLTNCRKNQTTFNAFFYANWSDSEGPLTLFIDDQSKGELPFISTRPSCDNDSLKQRALALTLKSGKHKITAKTQQGTVKSSGTITIRDDKTGVSGGIGGQEISTVGDCTFIGFIQ